MKQPAVYILASKEYGTLYVGVTSGLVQRDSQHKADLVPGFTSRYGIHTLVWYECYVTMESAIRREKRIKLWKGDWKISLITSTNLDWHDLYPGLL